MPDWPTMMLFFGAATILLVTPGPAVLYTISRSIDQGTKAGIVSVLGIGVGTFFHIVAAAFGTSALLFSSITAFTVVKYLGAAYLILLGIHRFMSKEAPDAARVPQAAGLTRIFVDGVVVNVLNPKTALFFFAFLPQFVDVSRGSPVAQVLTLGSIFVVLSTVVGSMYALLAGTAGRWLGRNPRLARTQRFIAGTVYIGLGVTTALSGPVRK